MTKRCEICRGDRVIRLPVHREVSGLDQAIEEVPRAVPVEDVVRVFPCPCCALHVPEERVQIVNLGARIGYPSHVPQAVAYSRLKLAHEIGEHLMRGGFITYEVNSDAAVSAAVSGIFRDGVVLTARVGVASPRAVESIEERTIGMAKRIAEAMAQAMIDRIAAVEVGPVLRTSTAVLVIREGVKQFTKHWSRAYEYALEERKKRSA